MFNALFFLVLIPTLAVGFTYELYVLNESEGLKKASPFFKYITLLFLFSVQEYFIAFVTYNMAGFICFQYVICIGAFMISHKFALMTSMITPVVINLFLYKIGEFSALAYLLSPVPVLIIFLMMNTFLNKSFTIQFCKYSITLLFISLLTMSPIDKHFNIHFYNAANISKVLVGCLLIIWFSYIFFTEISLKKKRIIELEYMKSHDKLTGLYNYREFTKKLSTIEQNSDRGYVTVMLDIDSFKKFNDEFGHIEGNNVLENFSKKLRDHMCNNNETNTIIYRFGGEEFCILLKNIPIELVHIKLNSFIKCLQADKYRTELGKEICISCSAGIADDRNCKTIFDTVKAADNALYQAKKKGKGQVVSNLYDDFSMRKV